MKAHIDPITRTITKIVPVPNIVACKGVILVPLSVKSSLSYHLPGSTFLPFQSTFKTGFVSVELLLELFEGFVSVFSVSPGLDGDVPSDDPSVASVYEDDESLLPSPDTVGGSLIVGSSFLSSYTMIFFSVFS